MNENGPIKPWVASHRGELFTSLIAFFVAYKAYLYIYRIFFHPLAKFPGPTICAATRLYEFYWDAVQHGRLWVKLPELHDRYGPIVRIGPDEIHIQDSQHFDTLFGSRPLDKNAFVPKQFGMKYAIWATEDYKLYTKKRAAFGDAFSRTKILRIEHLVHEHVDEMCDYIRQHILEGAVIDLSMLFRATPAEILTVYLFGQPYGLLKNEKLVRQATNKDFDQVFGLSHLGRFLPWYIPMMASLFRQSVKGLFGLEEPGGAWMNFYYLTRDATQRLINRQKTPSQFQDEKQAAVFDDFLRSSLPPEMKQGGQIAEQAMAIWSGGWDLTGFSMTMFSYVVLKRPECTRRIQDELRESWPDLHERPDVVMLERLPYFNAALKEILRMSAGVLVRINRVNPHAAEMYGDWVIPPGTTISMSIPDVLSDKKIWGSDPDVFRPERWLGRDDLDQYLVVFSKGTRNCVGSELAWMELRILLGTLFRRFRMQIPETANITDDDVLPYHELMSACPKNWNQKLVVKAEGLSL